MNSPAVQGDLRVNIIGSEFVVSWGPAVTEGQSAELGKAWSRCASPGPRFIGVPAEAGTQSRPFTACLTRSDGGAKGTHLQLAAGSFDELAELISSYLTLGAIDAQAGTLTMLHACGVADPETYRVLALVAKSGTGKTTSSRLLGQIFGYITDETVAIQPDGVVRPYPKPLSVRNEGPFKDQVGPDQLGLLEAPLQPFIHGIALLNRQDSWQGRPLVEKVPLADAVLALIPDTSSLGRIARPLQSLCKLLENTGGVRRITYAEASDLPPIVAGILQEDQEPPRKEWSARDSSVDESLVLPPGHFRRTNADDVVEIGGDLLVLCADQVTRISGIGPTIWEASGSAVSGLELYEAVTTEHGAPEGFEGLVDNALVQMLEQGALIHGRT